MRALNEDSVVATSPVFVVADGMGGHSAGEVASALVVDAFSAVAGRDDLSPSDVSVILETANRTLVERGRGAGEGGMGTTATGVILVRNGEVPSLLVFNVGDSRVYRVAGGTLTQLSVDHSYVQELVSSGHIGPDEARVHPNRNVVTRAVGIDAAISPDFWLVEPVSGERYIVCSDGLHGEVRDEAILAVALEVVDPQAAADRLVSEALDAGGRDNVTVVVLDVLDVVREGSSDLEITGPPIRDLINVPVVAAPIEADRPTVPTAIVEVPQASEPPDPGSASPEPTLDMIDGVPDFGRAPATGAGAGDAVADDDGEGGGDGDGSDGGVVDHVPD